MSVVQSILRSRVAWLAFLGVLGLAVLVARGPILRWSTEPLPAGALQALSASFLAYEEARALLAADRTDGLIGPARRIAELLDSAAGRLAQRAPELSRAAQRGVEAAERLATSSDLETARAHFAQLSEVLVSLGSVNPGITSGWHLFSCPMVDGFNQWFQRSEEIENPYMGAAMLACGVSEPWVESGGADGDAAHIEPERGHDEIAHYTCSMHPSVEAGEAGRCPICGMDLVPVTRREIETGVLLIDEQRRQRIGVRTAVVERRPARLTIRTVGEVDYDESRLADVSLKISGWVVKLHVDTTGQRVQQGEPLFTLYSPELYSAQEEYLQALRSRHAARATRAPDRADYLVRAARQRLRLWDIGEDQIREVARRGQSLEALPILSPATGYVIEKNVVGGGAVKAGDRLYRIAALDSVWVNAQVYETELPLISAGQRARVTLSYQPGRTFEGRVAYVYPYLDERTRTGRVRIELENSELGLRPDMYANVEFVLELGERLLVPDSAVLYTGPRRLVFLDLGEGRLRPQEVQLGVRTDRHYEVLSGLREGDRVVTSGNFLVAAESRIRSATRYWEDGREHH